MLDFAPSPETRPRSMLSLDFSPYLLSASPPSSGFSLDSLSLTSNYSPYSFFSSPPSRPSSAYTKVYGTSYVCDSPRLKSIMSVNSKDDQLSNKASKDEQFSNEVSKGEQLSNEASKDEQLSNKASEDDQFSKKISKDDQGSSETSKDNKASNESSQLVQALNETSKDDSGSTEASRSCQSSCSLDVTSSTSLRKSRHVSFADDVGRPLAEVRVVLDNPTAPPLLNFRGAPDPSRPGSLLNGDNGHSHVLVAPDPQPLARANFEHNLCGNLLAVENVLADNYVFTCTVLISTQPSSKRVFGRYTADSWRTFHDVQANYASSARHGYDRYQFAVTIPSSSDPSHSIQFAVCYEADGVQHWDNNDGSDFVVHWSRKAETEGYSLEDYNTNTMDYSGFDWFSNEQLDRPYY